jgi:hypothetical protein
MSIKATNTNLILAFKLPYPGLNVYGATKDHMVLTAADTERAAARVSVRRTEDRYLSSNGVDVGTNTDKVKTLYMV